MLYFKDKWIKSLEIILVVSCFLVTYLGLRISLEKYQEVESLAIFHKALLVFVVSTLVVIYTYFFHGKSIKTKILAITSMLVIVALINQTLY